MFETMLNFLVNRKKKKREKRHEYFGAKIFAGE